MEYRGPVIDPHHHLLIEDYDRYPWLKSENAFAPLEAWRLLQRDFTLDDYRAEIAGQNVVASVHVNAEWTDADGPLAETEWLESLDHSSGLIDRYVAGVAFGAPDTSKNIEDLAAFTRVVGFRQNIQWHPHFGSNNPRPAELTRTDGWRDALPILEARGLLLEFLLFPWQVDEVIEIAVKHPGLTIVVDHVLSPIDQSAEGRDQWKRAIEGLAAVPNIVVKLSEMQSYLAMVGELSDETLAAVIDHVVDTVGTSRAMFASDYPVARIAGLTYDDIFNQYRRVVAQRTLADQRDLFFSTAARTYGFEHACK